MSVDPESEMVVAEATDPEKVGSTALGIYVGTELRNRYRFKRRTPYDFYSNAGSQQASEFGVGV